MKKTIAILISCLLLFGVFSLSGCKRKTEADLSEGMHLQYDKSISRLDGNTVQSKKGNWRVVIHPCKSKSDLESRRSFFENTLTSIANSDVKSEEKTFGSLKFQTEYHTSGGKFAGSYFTVLDSPVKTNDIMHPIYGIYCYVTAESDAFIPEIESVMSGLYVDQV